MSDNFRFFVRGRVQGVGFRAFIERRARQEALNGWVRNLRDGGVEALLGPFFADQAEDFAAILEMGPGHVESVTFHSSEEDVADGLEVRPTF